MIKRCGNMTSVGYGCADLPFAVVYLCFGYAGMLILCSASILVYAVAQFCLTAQSKKLETKMQYRLLCITALFSLLVCMVGYGITIIYVAQCSTTTFEQPYFAHIISTIVIFFAISLLCIYSLMTLRVTLMLKGTIFELSKKWTLYFKYFITFLLVTFIVGTVGFSLPCLIDPKLTFVMYQIGSNCGSIWMLLYVINFTIIVVIFYNKLRLMSLHLYGDNKNKTCTDVDKNINTIDKINRKLNSNKNRKKRTVVFNLVIRITICCVIAIASSIIATVWIVVDSRWREKSNLFELIADTLIYPTDLLINGICLILQWPFSTNLYFKICSKCDRYIKRLCKRGCEFHYDLKSNITINIKSKTTINNVELQVTTGVPSRSATDNSEHAESIEDGQA